jgi:membrane associated rhomboid family serine protease
MTLISNKKGELAMKKIIILFVGVWLGLNLLFGTGLVPIAGEGVQIAWEAHVGGFVFGLLAFSLFDPVGRR